MISYVRHRKFADYEAKNINKETKEIVGLQEQKNLDEQN